MGKANAINFTMTSFPPLDNHHVDDPLTLFGNLSFMNATSSQFDPRISSVCQDNCPYLPHFEYPKQF